MVYTGLYNGNGQRQITIVSGLVYTGLFSPDGQYNGVVSNGSVYVGRYHACGAYNVTVATTLQSSAIAPDGSYYIYNGTSGYVLPGGSLGTVSTLPAWVINQSNPPNIALDWMNNLGYNSTSATPTAASLVTVGNATGGYVNDASGNWSLIGANLPRRSNLGLLVEEARTNLQPWAFDFSQAAAWNLTAASVGSTISSPVSGFNAQKLLDTATTAQHALISTGVAVVAGGTYTASAFVNSALSDYPQIRLLVVNPGFASAIGVTLTLANGVTAPVTSGTGVVAASGAIPYANGWYRLWITGVVDASSTSILPTLYLNGGASYLGSSLGTYATGIQLEAGASVTSIIPTTTVAVARAADVVTLTTPPTFGSAYTLYAKATPQVPVSYATDQLIIQVDDGSGNNRFSIRRHAGDGNGIGATSTGGVATAVDTATSWPQSVSRKLAFADANNDQAAVLNGGAVGTAAVGLPVGPLNVVRVGSVNSGGAQFNGLIEYSAIWANQRVPNAQLVSMTT